MTEDTRLDRVPSEVERLRLLLEEADNRAVIAESFWIGSLLRGCVVSEGFRVPDYLVEPIRLTSVGQELVDGVRAGHSRLKINDVKLATFLHFSCSGGLLVDVTTDIDALRRGISQEVVNKRILFPYIFGRELHDSAAELFPEKTSLTNSQTVKLLRQLPIGVFQEGHTTVGPFGCLRSDSSRQLPSSILVPGYLCSDETCSAIHSMELATASSRGAFAGINRAVEQVFEYVYRHYPERNEELDRLLGDALAQEAAPYALNAPESLIETVADALDLGELQSVVDRALRGEMKSAGARDISKRLSTVVRNPSEFVRSLDRASLLQVMLLLDDDAIIAAVDNSVRDSSLAIAEYEVRERRFSRFGGGGTSADIGARGVRFSSAPGGRLVARRLFELLHHLYFASGALEPADLAYLLGRPSKGASEQDLLGHAVRELPPERILDDLVLGSRRAADAAAKYLNYYGAGDETREEALQSLLWKLGVPRRTVFDDLKKIEALEAELKAGCSEPIQSEENLRGIISNLFTSAEDALQRSLEFATWALTVDHFVAAAKFVWDPAPNRHVLEFIDTHAPSRDPEWRLKQDGRNTLSPLAAAFSRLSKGLRSLDARPFTRPLAHVPQECRHTPRPFAFPSTLPFFNLTLQAQQHTTTALQEVAQLVGDAIVLRVRNATMHGNNDFPSVAEITLAIDKVAAWRKLVTDTGLYPQLFRLEGSSTDLLGREELRYHSDGEAVVLHRPGWAVAPGLPMGTAELVIMPRALTPSSGPLRFVLKAKPGSDAYWDGWPRRWRVESAYNAEARGMKATGFGDSLLG